MSDIKRGLYNRWNFEVAKFGTREGLRYNLDSILVEPGATVATDGVMLVKVDAPQFSLENFPKIPSQTTAEVTRPFLFPTETALKVAKALPRKGSIPILKTAANLQCEEDQAGFVSTDLEVANPAIVRKRVGTFPSYEGQFPHDEDKVLSITLDAKRLAKLTAFFAAFGSGRLAEVPLRLTFYQQGKPMLLEGKSGDGEQSAKALLMPMRD